eukprot:3295950-Pyramimonas_sp.AAC.1
MSRGIANPEPRSQRDICHPPIGHVSRELVELPRDIHGRHAGAAISHSARARARFHGGGLGGEEAARRRR